MKHHKTLFQDTHTGSSWAVLNFCRRYLQTHTNYSSVVCYYWRVSLGSDGLRSQQNMTHNLNNITCIFLHRSFVDVTLYCSWKHQYYQYQCNYNSIILTSNITHADNYRWKPMALQCIIVLDACWTTQWNSLQQSVHSILYKRTTGVRKPARAKRNTVVICR